MRHLRPLLAAAIALAVFVSPALAATATTKSGSVAVGWTVYHVGTGSAIESGSASQSFSFTYASGQQPSFTKYNQSSPTGWTPSSATRNDCTSLCPFGGKSAILTTTWTRSGIKYSSICTAGATVAVTLATKIYETGTFEKSGSWSSTVTCIGVKSLTVK